MSADAPNLAALSEGSSRADSDTTESESTSAQTDRGWMILDVLGVIRFCNAGLARIIGCPASELVGKPVKAVLPDMAFREGTPGYNVALARLENCWRPMELLQADGNRRSMTARVDHHLSVGGHLFFIELHCRI